MTRCNTQQTRLLSPESGWMQQSLFVQPQLQEQAQLFHNLETLQLCLMLFPQVPDVIA